MIVFDLSSFESTVRIKVKVEVCYWMRECGVSSVCDGFTQEI